MKTDQVYQIERPEQIELLASIVRQEILDSVTARGPCSISELADELGMAADSLYYHIRKLLEVGLLIEGGTRKTNRRDEVIYDLPGQAMSLSYDPSNPVNVQLINKVIASMLRGTERDFNAGFTPDMATVEGEARNLWAARSKVWLSEDELREVNELLARLLEICDRPKQPGTRQLCALTWVLTPVKAQPVRR